MEPSSFDSRHRVSVDELSVTERIFAKRAFNLESEFAIERDRRLVVCENGELDPRQIQPSVSQIDPLRASLPFQRLCPANRRELSPRSLLYD